MQAVQTPSPAAAEPAATAAPARARKRKTPLVAAQNVTQIDDMLETGEPAAKRARSTSSDTAAPVHPGLAAPKRRAPRKSLQTQVSELRSTITILRTQVRLANVEASANELASRVRTSTLQTQLDTANNELRGVRPTVASLRAENATMRTHVTALQQQSFDLRTVNGALQAMVRMLQSQLTDLQFQLQYVQNDNAALRATRAMDLVEVEDVTGEPDDAMHPPLGNQEPLTQPLSSWHLAPPDSPSYDGTQIVTWGQLVLPREAERRA